ncbi:hypothetical protein ACFL27_13775 [candidate division CSSED10-310 bacterium]|uniref:Uncharacterized protein n=1 Tax=candidate division CSSED10-310 bacterium TaxID=2855610 RepID=A0ABV6YYJ0_UNCC1
MSGPDASLIIELQRLVAEHLLKSAGIDVDHNLAQAQKNVRLLRKVKMRYADSIALIIQAAVCNITGEKTQCCTLLTSAEIWCRALNMALAAQMLNRVLGQVSGGPDGQDKVAKADQWMQAQGIKKPDRFTCMMTRGF